MTCRHIIDKSFINLEVIIRILRNDLLALCSIFIFNKFINFQGVLRCHILVQNMHIFYSMIFCILILLLYCCSTCIDMTSHGEGLGEDVEHKIT
jgi:hypothetical protein